MPKKTKNPKISDAEWEVMKVLWDTSPITANDVVKRLSPHNAWHPRTVKTMLNRLVNKGALGYEQEGNRYHYRPKLTKEACMKLESQSFLQRVFGGKATPMLAHFVENIDLTSDEIKELKKILTKKE